MANSSNCCERLRLWGNWLKFGANGYADVFALIEEDRLVQECASSGKHYFILIRSSIVGTELLETGISMSD